MSKYLLVFVVLSGCAPPKIDVAFQPYVNRWNDTYEKKADTSIQFGSMDKQYLGECTGDEILINPNSWVNLKDLGREQLVFHELGHCVLKLGHDSTSVTLQDSRGFNFLVYKSIMHPLGFGDTPTYLMFHDYYINELKTSTANETE